MKNGTPNLFDCLDENLRHLLCEIRFAESLISEQRHARLEIDAEAMATVVRRLAQQIETACDVAQQLRKATRKK